MGFFDFLFGKKAPPSIDHFLNELPKRGLTVMSLKALDFVVPGEWDNPTDFDALVAKVTGDDDPEYLGLVSERAKVLYNDEANGYQSARKIYSLVDSTDKLAGAAVAVEKIKILNFLDRLTPKPETTQTIDLAVKLAAEVVAFTKINGLPGDSFGDFAKALGHYSGDAKIRMAALLCFDGIIPLGPDCIDKVSATVDKLGTGELGQNAAFRRIAGLIPGAGDDSKLGFIKEGIGAATGWMSGFVKEGDLDQPTLLSKIGNVIDGAEDKLDYVGALLDATTNYMEHTGTQSIARSIIDRASAEV